MRVLTRDPERARSLLGAGAEIVPGDLSEPSSVRPALEGVERVYLATNGGDQALMEFNLIEAAKDAGVRRIVKVSLVGATHDTFVEPRRVHAAVEETVAASGIPATVLRASVFTDNFLDSADAIGGPGAIYGAAGDGRVAFVDARDIAAVAVEALTGEGHEGETYDVTGPEALTFAEAAEDIGAGIGRVVRYVELPDEDFSGALSGAGIPDEFVEIYSQGQRAAWEGTFAEVRGTVEELTGKPARTVEEFARDHAAALAGAKAFG